MTHVYEDEFHERADRWLRDEFGAENVEHEKYLPNAWRYIDFLVTTPIGKFAIEAERKAEKIIEGVGQSIMYAGYDPSYTPMVLVPHDHTMSPETEWIRQRIPVIEAPKFS